MVKAKVLLADNDQESRQRWSAVLQAEDYDVLVVPSVESAREALNRGGLDLAILDLRLEDDYDDKDDSGLKLAKEHYGSLPIIILSGDPKKEALLWALQQDKRPRCFLSAVEKNQGPEVLLREMRKAFPPKVFVSHGHDDGATSEVVSFLEDAGVQAVVLREQPRASQSLLELFEKHANVEFAVVLVTPDDTGSRRGQPPQPRARQNVIFELGFFLARLGRHRVVALCKEEGESIEWPSNYQGVLYREMDPGGGWQLKLAKDMKAVGVELHLV